MPKKSAWTDLDKVSFKKFVKESKVKIKKLAWTGLDKFNKNCLGKFQVLWNKNCNTWNEKKI